MINENVLFIIGAGASVDYGFPSGEKLINDIISKLDDGNFGEDLYGTFPTSKKQIRSFREHIEAARLESIDLWLRRNPSYSQIGRICIADEILKCEREYTRVNGWFESFWRKMVNGIHSFNELCNSPPNNILFITFNYDRMIEKLYYDALNATFFEQISQINNKEANILRIIGPKSAIRHVYGKCGELEWQAKDNKSVCKFGGELSGGNLVEVANNISFLGQNNKNTDYYKLISNFRPKKIFFLGFGFGEENLELLSKREDFDIILSDEKEIYGTSIGLSQKRINDIKEDISKRFYTTNVNIIPKIKCNELLNEYL
jgi:hypothetical protein